MEAAHFKASLLAMVTGCTTWVSKIQQLRNCTWADGRRLNNTLRYRNLRHPLPALEI